MMPWKYRKIVCHTSLLCAGVLWVFSRCWRGEDSVSWVSDTLSLCFLCLSIASSSTMIQRLYKVIICVILLQFSYQNFGPNKFSKVVCVRAYLRPLCMNIYNYWDDNGFCPLSLSEVREYQRVGKPDSLNSIPTIVDPWALDSDSERSFRYWPCSKMDNLGCVFLVWSRGPDRDFDISLSDLQEMGKNRESLSDMYKYVLLKTYDATNGTSSDGDIAQGGFPYKLPQKDQDE